jgi:hypothetical protein
MVRERLTWRARHADALEYGRYLQKGAAFFSRFGRFVREINVTI